MNKIKYSVIGGGWRSEFYLRIAALMPTNFEVAAICARNDKRAEELMSKYGCKTVKCIDELIKIPCDFIVNCTNKQNINNISVELAEKGFAVLSETPGIPPQDGYDCNLKLQVAEQYHLLPMNVAALKIIDSGILGEVNYVELSAAHDYHAMSLIRKFLNVNSKPLKVIGTEFNTKLLASHGRNGELPEKGLVDSMQTIKIYDFGNKKAVYNFSNDMYFSPIRKKHFLIRGTSGEIENDIVRYFNKNDEYIESKITRKFCGDLDGFFNGDITFEGKLLYKSPFKGNRISDEEEAVAMCLVKMKKYIDTGEEFYSLGAAGLDYELYMQ